MDSENTQNEETFTSEDDRLLNRLLIGSILALIAAYVCGQLYPVRPIPRPHFAAACTDYCVNN